MASTIKQRGPKLSVEDLRAAAAEMRAFDIIDIFAAGSGHPGGTLSIMDVAAALYLRVLNHDPKDPAWPQRDRVFWSAGHKAPALYVALGKAGYFSLDDTVLLRQFGARFEGHPNCLKLPGVEVSSGSLGQGLGVAVGNALAGKLSGRPYRVYCIMGDGEQQEGSIWESAMAAGHYKLDNLCGIIDKNDLQIDGRVRDVMNVDPLAEKYVAFGWNVLEVNGHDLGDILSAFDRAASTPSRPTVLLAHTVKGKGVSFMENQAGWHGIAPDREKFDKAMIDLATPTVPAERQASMLAQAESHARTAATRAQAKVPQFRRDYGWNAGTTMRVDMD